MLTSLVARHDFDNSAWPIIQPITCHKRREKARRFYQSPSCHGIRKSHAVMWNYDLPFFHYLLHVHWRMSCRWSVSSNVALWNVIKFQCQHRWRCCIRSWDKRPSFITLDCVSCFLDWTLVNQQASLFSLHTLEEWWTYWVSIASFLSAPIM